MRWSAAVIVPLMLGLVASPTLADWQADLDQLLTAEEGPERDRLMAQVLAARPAWQDIAAHIQALEFADNEKGKIILRTTVCIDGVQRPWTLYVPSGYDPTRATPLLVRLHGGVSRKNIVDDPVGYAEEDQFLALAEAEGWLVLYPYGQEGATWWDEVGMANIGNLVRVVKQEYNVDDCRVWMAGFSDGASAGFAHAMLAPSDYAAFVALNGHLGVGSLDGNLDTYAPNLANTPVYAVTTDQDALYPSETMGVVIDMAMEAGGEIFYRQLAGTHDFDYADQELPRIARFLKRHPRDPWPLRILWETARPEFGTCRWFAIDEVTIEEPAGWHLDYNAALVDDRVTIGFVSDDSFDGKGVKVGTVVEETAAEDMNLEEGDVIVSAEDMEIADMDDLVAYKARLSRGDPFELTVSRGDQELVLAGVIPEASDYYCFKRERPSALGRVWFSANRVVLETSRVGAFHILVHPDMISLDQNLVVEWNGRIVHDAPVKPDIEFMLRNFLHNRDRSLLYVARVEFSEG